MIQKNNLKKGNMVNLILFIVSTIGMTHIIVDGSILERFRIFFKEYSKKLYVPTLGSIVDCYLCSGTWCGFLMGYIWISKDPLEVFACGCAGGFLANFAATVSNWIESATIMNFPNENDQ